MSKSRKPVFVILLVLACLAVRPIGVPAQYVEATITVDPESARAKVSGTRASAAGSRRNLSFLASAIGVPNLGRRISSVALRDASGKTVPHKAFNSAEYVAGADFSSFSYEIDLKPAADPRSAAHASWVGTDEGVIFLDDVLPQPAGNDAKRAVVSIVITSGWRMVSPAQARADGVYDFPDAGRSVFVVGKNIRQIKDTGAKQRISVAISGRWLFDDADARNMSDEVFRGYADLFGQAPADDSLLVLVPIPQAGVPKGVWEAETRGSTVVIASSDMAFRTQSVQRLHEQLRHEILHLWVPNGVNLTGRYDWFYEGFALYQSLKTGVSLNRIRFDDFLDTLSRAHDIDRSQTRRLSMIEASKERWAGAETQLYARGMLVAFLCDLVLLQGSNGRTSIEKLLARLYSTHKHPAAAVDANEAVLRLLEADPKLAVLSANYIRGANPVDWAGIIEAAGLETEPGRFRTILRVKANPTGRQKTVLDKLGYNNWRKLTRK